ncbi:MAG TPA: ABC transporter ATP-binding protein [Blastocatellia bacterium]
MSEIVIRSENLGKKYSIRHEGSRARYTALRDVVASKFSAPRRWLEARRARTDGNGAWPSATKGSRNKEDFWALRDVSFDVNRGDVVGIIGRNGAGKSTLLKILTRITEPTTGRAGIKGRVASLLEVGTGFHPELTGRENIYLNGAILGMSRAEIKLRFDEIVDFAEIEKFLDTPVKRYSSGMYVRLAFAVAAHLEPDILVIDEVLAVGDSQFQKKCLGKMGDVASGGRTVLFVSHSMAAIEKLCSRGLYINSGKLVYLGDTSSAVEMYLRELNSDQASEHLLETVPRKGSGLVRITAFSIEDGSGQKLTALRSGQECTFVLEYKNMAGRPLENVVCSIAMTDERNQMVFLVRSNFTNQNVSISGHAGRIECHIKELCLTVGLYSLRLFISHGEHDVLDWIEAAGTLSVEAGDFFGTGSQGLPSHCKVLTRADWDSYPILDPEETSAEVAWANRQHT